jgi:Holliday junction resolvase
MKARGTLTGGVLERMILPALDAGGYEFAVRVNVGTRLGHGVHFVDVVASKESRSLLISLKVFARH